MVSDRERAAMIEAAMKKIGRRVPLGAKTQPYWGDERKLGSSFPDEIPSARVAPPWRRKFKRR